MKQLSVVSTFLVLALLVVASAADAQATRTWVSGVGDDANPCSRTAPCKTFAGAISKTATNGEISVLDPGGFGAVTITKAITINGDGTLGGILASLTNGVIVNVTADANARVVLRNISINGGGNGINGVRYLAAKSLTLDNVTISGFTGNGIDVSLGADGKLFVLNSRITNCSDGVRLNTTVGQAQAMLFNVSLTGLANGVEAVANGRATVSNSLISGNTGSGILANSASARINVEGSQLSFNGTAINAAVAGAIIRISNNEIYNNTTGIGTLNGTVETAGNNRHAGDVTPGAPSAVSIPIQ